MVSPQLKKLDNEIRKDINKFKNNRKHANFNLLTLVIFVACVFLAAAFIYHFQLGFFYNQLVEKDLQLDEMESTLTNELSRLENSEEELLAKAQYEQDLINKFTETQETSESLERQIQINSDTVVQRQNRLLIEQGLFRDCDQDRDLLLEENQELKEDLLDIVDERNDARAELESCQAGN